MFLSVIMKQNLEMPISIWMKVKSCYRNTFIKKMNCVLMALRLNSHEPVHLPIGAYYHRLFDDSYGLYYYYTQLDNPDLVEKIDKMLKKSRYIGIFCVEFFWLIKNDNLLFFGNQL